MPRTDGKTLPRPDDDDRRSKRRLLELRAKAHADGDQETVELCRQALAYLDEAAQRRKRRLAEFGLDVTEHLEGLDRRRAAARRLTVMCLCVHDHVASCFDPLMKAS